MNKSFKFIVFMLLGSTVFTINNIEMNNLQPSQGLTFIGDNAYANLGSSVGYPGDVNGDGVDDIVIGGCYDCSSAGSWVVYVVFGSKTGLADFDFINWNNNKGFKITGEYAFLELSHSVSGAGDINGDGLGDLVIGSPEAGPNREGIVYVIFGSKNELNDIDLKTGLSNTRGFKILGSNASARFGYSARSAGDINGDGVDDIVIGEPLYSLNGRYQAGAAYVIFGSKEEAHDINLSSGLSSTTGFRVIGLTNTFRLGTSVNAAGDINADGVDDLLLGAFKTTNGSTIVLFGKKTAFSEIDMNISFSNTDGFQIIGSNQEESATCVSGSVDINGDGIDDIIIGAPKATVSGRDRAGIVYVVYGSKNILSDINLSSLNNNQGFRILGSQASTQIGKSLSGAGDINRDGVKDLIIGEYYSTNSAYLVFGSKTGFTGADIDLSVLSNTQGVKLIGASSSDQFGNGVSMIGDVNGDGASDVIIAAVSATRSQRQFCGAVYLIFGGRLLNSFMS